MNKRQIIAKGLARGYSIAKSIDLVDIGDYGEGRFLDERKKVKITSDNWLEFHTNYAYECESNDRQFSPFEFLANVLIVTENNPRVKFEPWLEFDEAISRGIRKALKERWKSIRMTKEDYWKSFEGSRDLFDECWKMLRCEAKHTEIDFNENLDIEQRLENFASDKVNDPRSRFYIYG
jgi:hypothetical protein